MSFSAVIAGHGSNSNPPSLVQTDMGNRGAQFAGLSEAPVTLDSSVQGLVAMVSYPESIANWAILTNTDHKHYESKRREIS